MPAKKTKKPVARQRKISPTKHSSFMSEYFRQRDRFFETHRYARVLLGVLIISFAMAIGVLYYNKTIVFIGLSLEQQYGVRYPYANR